MDGKQARKTNNSSPLGLLFDHGADSLNTVLLMLIVPSLLQTGVTWPSLAFGVCIMTGFFSATLEQYYVGSLNLPAINGVSDACLVIMAIDLIAATKGKEKG
jgi:ethanolaminephosphotransferase